jgi:hypothetical protein
METANVVLDDIEYSCFTTDECIAELLKDYPAGCLYCQLDGDED